jgi:3-hydroxyisobutyrate dehydrogenase-like beta-hydroxyacid dehydrogenase
MSTQTIGILHPGEMGISVASTALNSGNEVLWASTGRSEKTHIRAQKYNLQDAVTLTRLCKSCTVIICLCPPHAAEDVAQLVIGQGFQGLYVEANAISPQKVQRIGLMMAAAGVDFVDGGIIGGPAWEPNRTWLYLSGDNAQTAAACFSAGPLETKVIGDDVGKASAIKMCYAAYTKGTTALLCAIHATAERLGVLQDLQQQWSIDDSDFAEQSVFRLRRVTAKAWRFAGEMDEIAATFSAAGLPSGFHEAASDVYHRISGFKEAPSIPPLEDVLAALLQKTNDNALGKSAKDYKND